MWGKSSSLLEEMSLIDYRTHYFEELAETKWTFRSIIGCIPLKNKIPIQEAKESIISAESYINPSSFLFWRHQQQKVLPICIILCASEIVLLNLTRRSQSILEAIGDCQNIYTKNQTKTTFSSFKQLVIST